MDIEELVVVSRRNGARSPVSINRESVVRVTLHSFVDSDGGKCLPVLHRSIHSRTCRHRLLAVQLSHRQSFASHAKHQCWEFHPDIRRGPQSGRWCRGTTRSLTFRFTSCHLLRFCIFCYFCLLLHSRLTPATLISDWFVRTGGLVWRCNVVWTLVGGCGRVHCWGSTLHFNCRAFRRGWKLARLYGAEE